MLKAFLCMNANFAMLTFYSTLGGSHGVPRVHYKGRQGDYYIMVCSCKFFNKVTGVSIVSESFCNIMLHTGHGYAWL